MILCLVSTVGLAYAQSPVLPATAPTAAGTPAAAAAPEQAATHRAKVVYSEGQLSVVADNSSLNQILRDISRQTGMKITGGVTEQRVFGKYGPGSPSVVLANLIEGAGSNMLLRYGPSQVPVELVLAPRMGGASPPSPDARRRLRPQANIARSLLASSRRPRHSLQPRRGRSPTATSSALRRLPQATPRASLRRTQARHNPPAQRLPPATQPTRRLPTESKLRRRSRKDYSNFPTSSFLCLSFRSEAKESAFLCAITAYAIT